MFFFVMAVGFYALVFMALVLQPEIMLKLPRAESSSVRGRGINVVPQLTFQLQDMQGIRFLSGPGRRDLV